MVQPGEFRQPTEINVISLVQNGFGSFETDSEVVHTRFAKVKWLPGSEKIDAEVVSLQKNVEFTYRFESLTELINRIDTIKLGTDYFYIKSVEYKGVGNQQLVILKGHTAQNK